jgi:hypothetical protein
MGFDCSTSFDLSIEQRFGGLSLRLGSGDARAKHRILIQKHSILMLQPVSLVLIGYPGYPELGELFMQNERCHLQVNQILTVGGLCGGLLPVSHERIQLAPGRGL